MSCFAPGRNRRQPALVSQPQRLTTLVSLSWPSPFARLRRFSRVFDNLSRLSGPCRDQQLQQAIRRCCIVIASDQTSRSPEPSEGAAISSLQTLAGGLLALLKEGTI